MLLISLSLYAHLSGFELPEYTFFRHFQSVLVLIRRANLPERNKVWAHSAAPAEGNAMMRESAAGCERWRHSYTLHTHPHVSSLVLTGPLAEAVIESARDCLESRRAYSWTATESEMSSDCSSVRCQSSADEISFSPSGFTIMTDHIICLSHLG